LLFAVDDPPPLVLLLLLLLPHPAATSPIARPGGQSGALRA
jgi:hypothetical protein